MLSDSLLPGRQLQQLVCSNALQQQALFCCLVWVLRAHGLKQ